MEHIPKSNAEIFEKESTTSWEYTTSSEAMNVALIKIDGRYPKEGFTSNLKVDSIVHIIGGEGALITPDCGRVELAAHDQVHIAVGDAYCFEGNLEMIYCATPK